MRPILVATLFVAACGGGVAQHPGEDMAPAMMAGGLTFGVFGDCRPPNVGETSQYPTAIASNIFSLLQQHGAQFVVGTGDYMFADTAADVTAQVALLQQAEANFKGPIYHAMGNHECTGATASNCPNGNETPNVQAFMSKLVPQGTQTPYYRVDVATPNGKAKFLFVAGNAWSTAQQTWLQAQLADATTYTFIVRHVPPGTSAPGVTESEALVTAAPFTLELLGHFHEYKVLDPKHVISGNGGAASRSGEVAGFGFLLVEQEADGTLAATEYDQTTGDAIDAWKISPTGERVN